MHMVNVFELLNIRVMENSALCAMADIWHSNIRWKNISTSSLTRFLSLKKNESIEYQISHIEYQMQRDSFVIISINVHLGEWSSKISMSPCVFNKQQISQTILKQSNDAWHCRTLRYCPPHHLPVSRAIDMKHTFSIETFRVSGP